MAKFIRHSRLALIFLLIVSGCAGIIYKNLPSTFVPNEDQGYMFAAVEMPDGTSANRTQAVIDKLNVAMMENVKGLQSTMAITGFSPLSGGSSSSAGMIVVGMKDWSQREDAASSVDAAVRTAFGIGAKVAPEATVIAMNPPALPGLGMTGGWTLQLQDMTGHSETELNDVTKKIVAEANQRPELAGVRSTYSVGIQLSDVFTAMQVNYGGYQVNDFNRFGRSYKVMLQADNDYRSSTDQMKFIFVKSSKGTMVPLDTLLRPKLTSGPSSISRFNGTRSIQITGQTGNGYSSGQAMNAIKEVVQANAGTGFNIEWSGQSREEAKASNSTMQVLVLSLVFGALVSEYGLSIIEAMFGHQNAGLQDSVYMQIGIIAIIGLAAKNAILIVEFAKVRVDRGMEPVKAAIEAAGLRLRPILMTSFAFIIGCIPLAIATGAGAAARNGMGVAVVGGMLFATAMGIFLIPVFFVAMEWIAAKLGLLKQERKKSSADYM